jgi:flavin reductase (DIM6/NTAB) family NADH-FMN oxidoreductase RutF
VFALLDYPMFVVTTRAEGERAGCLVGFATQASINPARFLVGLSNKNRTYRVARRAERLAVHVLDPSDRELAALFGTQTGDDVDKFERCTWTEGPGGVPLLSQALAWFTGPILGQHPVGDHVAFLIEPDDGDTRAKSAELLTFDDVRDLDAGHDA